MCRAISIVRSGGMGYLRTSKYFSVLRANSGEVREGYTPFFKAGSKCAFRKKNSYPVSLRITCDICNRHFRSLTCSDNHKKKTRAKRKSSCELRKCCGTCGAVITRNTHECNKRFYTTQKENKEAGHLCFVHPLVKVPASSERVLYVIYDFETTHDTKRSDTTNEHVPNLDCCNNSVLNARTWQIYDRIAFSAAHAYTRSGTILWEIR
jgi:hypothetical protein